jgi:hypothetical protein
MVSFHRYLAFTLTTGLFLAGCGGGGGGASIAPSVGNALPTPTNQTLGSIASAASRAASQSVAANSTAEGA